MKPTGGGGGLNALLNEIDNLVLDIIGSNSPAVIGLKVRESRIEGAPIDGGSHYDVGEVEFASQGIAVSGSAYSAITASSLSTVGITGAKIAS